MKVTGLDHIALAVSDVERSLAFYTGTLGLEPVDADAWRRGEVDFPSVRVSDATIIDLFASDAAAPVAPVHFCLVVEPLDWDAVVAAGLTVETGPVLRSGARGHGTAVYLSDPDGHSVELRYYARGV